LLLVLLVGGGYMLTRTTTYRQGVNFQVLEVELPLWRKIWHFLDRHWQYQEILSYILNGSESPTERTLKLFAWTHHKIRPAPEGFPVVDDHVLNIIIRGYGGNDQVADVFASLLAYADVPARWYYLPVPGESARLTVVTVKLEGAWRVMDPYYGNVFRTKDGTLASVEDIERDPTIVDRVSAPATHRGVPYREYFSNIAHVRTHPGFNRGPRQAPWYRLTNEVKRRLGLASNDGRGM
jgi:hypothetical protein